MTKEEIDQKVSDLLWSFREGPGVMGVKRLLVIPLLEAIQQERATAAADLKKAVRDTQLVIIKWLAADNHDLHPTDLEKISPEIMYQMVIEQGRNPNMKLCFSCDVASQKYIDGMCEKCHQVAMEQA